MSAKPVFHNYSLEEMVNFANPSKRDKSSSDDEFLRILSERNFSDEFLCSLLMRVCCLQRADVAVFNAVASRINLRSRARESLFDIVEQDFTRRNILMCAIDSLNIELVAHMLTTLNPPEHCTKRALVYIVEFTSRLSKNRGERIVTITRALAGMCSRQTIAEAYELAKHHRIRDDVANILADVLNAPRLSEVRAHEQMFWTALIVLFVTLGMRSTL